MEKTINSKDNKLIKLVRKLFTDKKVRNEMNMFVCETVRVVDMCLNFKIVNILIASDSKYLTKYNQPEVVIVNSKIFASLSDLANSDGVIGVFFKPKIPFAITPNRPYVILDHIQNPGNLGSLIRSAVAFKMGGIVITNDSVDIYHPQIIRSTMGAIFKIGISISTNLLNTIALFKQNNFVVYATALTKDATDVNAVKFTKQSVVIFGNEGNGIDPQAIKQCDQTIYIPISSDVNSLNVGVAGGIIMQYLSAK
jgi:TrmH family RNA methyltransferase